MIFSPKVYYFSKYYKQIKELEFYNYYKQKFMS